PPFAAPPGGNPAAWNRSVPPGPAASRRDAYAWAMNHDVPQPTTATRSPGSGRPGEPASPAARIQHSGWVAVLAWTKLMLILPPRVPAHTRSVLGSFERHSAWRVAGGATIR